MILKSQKNNIAIHNKNDAGQMRATKGFYKKKTSFPTRIMLPVLWREYLFPTILMDSDPRVQKHKWLNALWIYHRKTRTSAML